MTGHLEIQAKKEAEKLESIILEVFPEVAVESMTRSALIKEFKGIGHRGYPSPESGVHAYILIQSDPETVERAGRFARSEALQIAETKHVNIKVLPTNEVWCRRSSIPMMQPVGHGKPPLKPLQFYSDEDSRNIYFLCLLQDNHEHEWGKIQPKH